MAETNLANPDRIRKILSGKLHNMKARINSIFLCVFQITED